MTAAQDARCPHGCSLATICPYCDHHAFLVSYAKTRNVIERMGWSDDDIERIVREVEGQPEPSPDDVGSDGPDER